MAGVTVADSLRAMVNVAKDANFEELQLEKARLETRLDAINRLLDWREKISQLVDAASSGPAIPVSTPSHVPPAVRVPPSAHQRSVDSYDPPPRHATKSDVEKMEGGVTLNHGVEVDDAGAAQRTMEYLCLPTSKRSAAFAERLSQMVLMCGREEETVGYSTPASFVKATGMTGHYVSVLLVDSRVTARITRCGHGKYKLTEAGRELYKALVSPAMDGAGCE